jgi:type I restriction enzyme M protein
MPYKKLIKYLGFVPKENTSGIYQKKYAGCKDYYIEVDAETEKINYGTLINAESSTTLNFTQNENWVVLECVNRLLEKGYQPQNIVLEKTWATGHGTSGRLDILVTRNDGSSYLMIECKVWGTEFDKEQKRIDKDGGQLFTYFQQDKNADILMLYSSDFDKSEISFKNLIIKIEEDYRQTGNVKDFYERWNKLPKTNGIFESWVTPYEYQSKALTKKDLKVLRQEDSSFIFNRFLEILRHNVVSDKPNAFNKIFTLFLCKIVDENRNDDEQLHFQWIEGEDTHISFQKRLTDLYNRGMLELLEKTVTDVSDSEFDKRFKQVDDKYREEFKNILTEIRLKKNNEFAIKEVYDDESFLDNAKVVKEIIELLQVYQLRYNYRQQFLSDFFELLLTTGLKQESGQFFTPVPVARFILRSIPTIEIIERKLLEGNKNDLLPTIIDYAAGSGHFVTESMEDIQKYIDGINDVSKYSPETKKTIKSWKDAQFDWAEKYVYAIEKDYRLVKTAKVSCYLHGDGLAKVIHGDGLGDFGSSKDFKDLLKTADRTYQQDNKQFDIVVSNPPYSVSAFKGNMMDEEKANNAFDLYSRLTDQSCEIECLFIERTKQLLKDGGIAGIILPSSILSNSGIYTQSREIIFKYFEIIAITELGNNTFMATGTNTVILFVRRRNNADWINIRASVDKFAINLQDVTINGIENPVSKYVTHVWENIGFDDYLTLIQKQPNAAIKKHELFKEYDNKVKARNQQEKLYSIVAIELEKLFYFILAYPQKIVLVKSGEKDAEKQFLGYEFSNRRGSEGIHPIQRSKTIDECTKLYDAVSFNNPEKASTYIYKNFKGEHDFEIHGGLKNNITQLGLVDMLSFDRVDFEKTISLAVKKKVIIRSKFNSEKIENIFLEVKNGKNVIQIDSKGLYRVSRIESIAEAFFNINATKWTNDNISENDFLKKGDILMSHINSVEHLGKTAYFNIDEKIVHGVNLLRFRPDKSKVIPKYISEIFKLQAFIAEVQKYAQKAANQASLNTTNLKNLKVPLPPIGIQEKIVSEIEILENQEEIAKQGIESLKEQISQVVGNYPHQGKVSDICLISGEKINPQNFTEREFLYVGLEHIESNTGKLVSQNIEKGVSILSTKNTFVQGDVLYGKLRPYLNKVFIAESDGICSTDILVLKSKNALLLKHILLSHIFVEQTSALMKGLSLPRIKVNDFLKIKVPVIHENDQKQIVQQIENLENQINDLQKHIDLIPQQKEQILKKYLE